MKSRILASIFLLNSLVSAQEVVPVAVVVQEAKFEDKAQKDRMDSAADLRKALRGKEKTLRLVDTPAEAVVIVEVLGRGLETQDTKRFSRSLGGQVEQRSDQDKVLRIKLSVGDYSTEIGAHWFDGEMRIPTWSGAARRAAAEIDEWIKANRDKLP